MSRPLKNTCLPCAAAVLALAASAPAHIQNVHGQALSGPGATFTSGDFTVYTDCGGTTVVTARAYDSTGKLVSHSRDITGPDCIAHVWFDATPVVRVEIEMTPNCHGTAPSKVTITKGDLDRNGALGGTKKCLAGIGTGRDCSSAFGGCAKPGGTTTGSVGKGASSGSGISYGNLFDFRPLRDLQLYGMDVSTSALGGTLDVALWYREGTSFGHESNPLGDWIRLGSFQGQPAGLGEATSINLSAQSHVFERGRTYGLFVEFLSAAAVECRDTPGAPAVFTDRIAELETNAAKDGPGLLSGTIRDRQWDGMLYFDDVTTPPAVALSNFISGSTGTVTVSGATPSSLVGIALSATGGGPIGVDAGSCGLLAVDLSAPLMVLGILTADASGTASLSVAIPPGTNGMPIWVQALDFDGCTIAPVQSQPVG